MRFLFVQVKNLLSLALWPVRAVQAKAMLRGGGFVTLQIDGEVGELPEERPFWVRVPAKRTSLARVRELTLEIAKDPKVKGLVLELRSLHAGAAVATSLREALAKLAPAGKELLVHLPLGAGSREMLVASAASKLVLGPQSTILPLGVAIEARYFRRALDKLGVVPEIFARGEFKTAGESLARDSMSDPQREQLGAVLDAVHGELVHALAEGRKVTVERARELVDEGPYRAPDARSAGLADAVAYEDELPRIASGGAKKPPRMVKASIYLGARARLRVPALRTRRIGVVHVRGPIVSKAPLPLGKVAVDDRIIAALRVAREDRHIPGVVLLVDSPGGSALASDRIYHEVLRVAEEKPVVAYFANVAASGGYYVAAGAHSIVAQPTTITGSIGVIAAHIVVGPLLEKLGIVTELVKRGARADMLSSARPVDPGEREALLREIEGFYREFVEIVARGRGRDVAKIEPLARGRVYSGKHAFELGLVDALGGFDRALEEVRSRIGAGGQGLEPIVIRPPRTMPRPPELRAPFVDALEAALGAASLRDAALLALGCPPHERVLAWSGVGWR